MKTVAEKSARCSSNERHTLVLAWQEKQRWVQFTFLFAVIPQMKSCTSHIIPSVRGTSSKTNNSRLPWTKWRAPVFVTWRRPRGACATEQHHWPQRHTDPMKISGGFREEMNTWHSFTEATRQSASPVGRMCTVCYRGVASTQLVYWQVNQENRALGGSGTEWRTRSPSICRTRTETKRRKQHKDWSWHSSKPSNIFWMK